MLYWECKRRLAELRHFRELVQSYFAGTGFDTRGRRHASESVIPLRTDINKMIPESVRSCYRVGQGLSVSYLDPSTGYNGSINLIENLFSLDRFRIPVSKAIDYLERTIGIYERELVKLRRASWNPLYWFKLGFLWVIGFPFRILGAAGFNASALEQSLGGKIVKALVGFVVFIAALLQAISLLGLPTGWKDLAHLVHK
ncbi:MAG TPA: hypothetical protein VN943_06255 [Candidatus Acidoferrum sp.]|nr:hypothetical protein [Candidatus Acidoferrum sp.]